MRSRPFFLAMVLVFCCFTLNAQPNWVTAYFAGWAKWNATPVDIPQIDFMCATHWIFFTMAPTGSGAFDGTGSGIDDSRHRQFVNAVHAAGKKAIIGTGGWGADYTGVVTNRTTSINYLTNLMQTYGYDGVDVDWEPVPSGQYSNFSTWVRDLKAAMKQVKSDAVLTAACFSFDQAIVSNQQHFDQINLMTYDMSGPWPGWISWHNSAIFDGGNRFPSTNGLVPSIDASVNGYTNAGVPASKVGFGIEFYGYIWDNVTGPLQSNFGNVRNTVPYAEIMDKYSALQLKWDTGAQAAYYSSSNQFISFDAETTMAVKAQYMRAKGLGGVIIYEAAAGYRGNLPAGYKDRLLQSVKQAFMGGAPPPSDTTPPSVVIVSPTNNATLLSNVNLQANATDNLGVVGVQFMLDGNPVGNEDLASPYTANLNTWQFSNGPHTVSAVARDWAGNRDTASVNVAIANIGPPPIIPDLVVFDDYLHSPFMNASWSATVNFSNSSPTKDGSTSIRVDYGAWGGFDLLSGQWDAEVPIDVAVYDSLRFDAYGTSQFDVTVAFYIGSKTNVTLRSNTWTSFSVPLPTESFTRFYFGSTASTANTAYFDNIRFGARQTVSGISSGEKNPLGFVLEQNYPNPFNPSTTINFTVRNTEHVTLTVYDFLGSEVATLVNEGLAAGTYSVIFDAQAPSKGHKPLASGVYLYRLQAGEFVSMKKLILIK